MTAHGTLEIPIEGMDCADCTRHVQRAIADLPGVESVEVYLASEKAVIRHRGDINVSAIRKAVATAGYSVPEGVQLPRQTAYARSILALLGFLFGAVLLVVVAGEWLGLFETFAETIPWPLGLALVLLIGYPVFLNVARATYRLQIIAHTLMTVGVVAALVVGEWTTAAVVAFFMRVGDFVEGFTTERARRAVKDLSTLAPQTARVLRDGLESLIPIDQVQAGEIVVVRPGEQIPVDGEVIAGHATVDQGTITGESMPVEAGPGSQVYAATLASQGTLRVRASHIGQDTTFGRVIRLVEEAEARRGVVQRLADRFSAIYLPVVVSVAVVTYLFGRDPLATAAVLVVACSCAFALATPIAILASVGAGARRGLLIKGGKYLEILPKADVLLIDKTGTLTLGKPQITDLVISNQYSVSSNQFSATGDTEYCPLTTEYLLQIAASVERYSEHPLAEAVRRAAMEQGITLEEPEEFEALPGLGVRARLNGNVVSIGNPRLIGSERDVVTLGKIAELEAQGKTLLYVVVDGSPVGVLAAADTLRPEVPRAIAQLRELKMKHIELLTGDNSRSAASLAGQLGIPYRAELLPEDKIAIVKDFQARGHTVVMVGDGVNDAPALAQADVGIAMGAAGSGIAMEAAHVVLLRDDWTLIPEVFRIARRTLRVVKTNIGFTAVYNLVGLTLAALGFLPPVLAAAAQSLPDLLILANSSRLIQQK
jgi:Cd2+/Zn2+-exporting ATPase/Cu+-exporting ATPase